MVKVVITSDSAIQLSLLDWSIKRLFIDSRDLNVVLEEKGTRKFSHNRDCQQFLQDCLSTFALRPTLPAAVPPAIPTINGIQINDQQLVLTISCL
jgi:hypothetical protein